MSKPLEPTEEQLDAIHDLGAGHARAELRARVWPLIRDMVLEAAAMACPEEYPAAQLCAERIRAMKGTP